MRRLARISAVCCAVFALVLPFAPAPSGAEAPQETGWWSRRLPFQGEVEGQSARRPVAFNSTATPGQELPVDTTIPGGTPGGNPGGPVTTVPLPVPPPTLPQPPVTLPEDGGPGSPNPVVPEGGLWVANDLTGASAVSALRFRGDIGSGELTLTFAPGGTTVGPVVACPIISDWTAGPEGAWRDRPAHDCDRFELSGLVTADGSALTFEIPQGFQPFGARTLDVMILPNRSSGDVFSLYFEKPDADSLTVRAGQEPPSDPDFDFDLEPDFSSPTFDGGGTGFDSGSDFGSGGDFDAGPVDDETAAPIDLTGDDGSPLPTPIADVFAPFTESRTGRILAMAVLLAMGAGLWWLSSQTVRNPRLIGGLATGGPAVVEAPQEFGRGIGRFRRERSAPPERL